MTAIMVMALCESSGISNTAPMKGRMARATAPWPAWRAASGRQPKPVAGVRGGPGQRRRRVKVETMLTSTQAAVPATFSRIRVDAKASTVWSGFSILSSRTMAKVRPTNSQA
ncbi:MAG: hypothetical protein WDN69_23425 [Aliidongia sp.]